jgi:hypothetical protein
MRCLFCFFRSKRNSVKCQFCERYFEKSQDMQDGLAYLENGFDRVSHECDLIEEKTSIVVGFIFKRHKYSAEDLLQSEHMEKINSFASKIKADIDAWEAAGKLPFRVKMLYNEKVQEVRDRVAELNRMAKERRPTFWESIGGFFQRLYQLVIARLPMFVQGLITFKKRKAIEQQAA